MDDEMNCQINRQYTIVIHLYSMRHVFRGEKRSRMLQSVPLYTPFPFILQPPFVLFFPFTVITCCCWSIFLFHFFGGGCAIASRCLFLRLDLDGWSCCRRRHLLFFDSRSSSSWNWSFLFWSGRLCCCFSLWCGHFGLFLCWPFLFITVALVCLC